MVSPTGIGRIVHGVLRKHVDLAPLTRPSIYGGLRSWKWNLMPSLQLTSSQQKYLRGLGHSLKVVVTVGRKGVGDSAIKEIDSALSFHELIKIRLGDGGDLSKAERRELCAAIAGQVECGLAGLVGHVAVLYRPHPDPEKRRVRLPAA